MILPGKISINRTTSNKEGDFVSIEITDEKSHVQFCRIKISLLEFAKVITGLSFRSCELDLMGLDAVGKIREHKEEIIPLPNKEKQDETLAPYEIDGWIGDRRDLLSHHRWFCKDDKWFAKVNFTRYV